MRHCSVYFIDKSRLVTAESRNVIYSLKIQLYNGADCFQFPSKKSKILYALRSTILRSDVSKARRTLKAIVRPN